MQCPTDGAVLVMSDRNGIEIDYCPTCRGVWLDRGELDKILERSYAQSAPAAAPAAPAPGSYEQQRDERRQQYDGRSYDQRPSHSQRGKKKESWLSAILD